MNNNRLVYSSDSGKIASRPGPKGKPPAKQSGPPSLPDDGVVRLFREKGNRGGKTVTVIRGLPASELETRVSEFKRLCGAGGTLREGAIEIQGDHRDRLAERLTSLGYRVKLAGG